MQYTGDVLQNCTLGIYTTLSTNVTPIHFSSKKHNHTNKGYTVNASECVPRKGKGKLIKRAASWGPKIIKCYEVRGAVNPRFKGS